MREEMSVEFVFVRVSICELNNIDPVVEFLRERRVHNRNSERKRGYLIHFLGEYTCRKPFIAVYIELVNIFVVELYCVQIISPHSFCLA